MGMEWRGSGKGAVTGSEWSDVLKFRAERRQDIQF